MTDFAGYDTWLEDRANYSILHDDECPDIECAGHMVYNKWTNTRDCTGCSYREDMDMVQVGGRKELV